MDVHLDVTFGDKDTGLGSEVIDCEVGLQVVDLKSDFVGFLVGGENDIVGGLLNVKCNVMEVGLAIDVDIWHINTVEDGQ
jgi:hypothetical protein